MKFKMISDAHFMHFAPEKDLSNVSRYRVRHKLKEPFDKRSVPTRPPDYSPIFSSQIKDTKIYRCGNKVALKKKKSSTSARAREGQKTRVRTLHICMFNDHPQVKRAYDNK